MNELFREKSLFEIAMESGLGAGLAGADASGNDPEFSQDRGCTRVDDELLKKLLALELEGES